MTYKEEFIKFMVDSGVLTFGDFTLKSGRKAPYFINCGNYKTGEQLAKLGGFYADCIADNKIPVETLSDLHIRVSLLLFQPLSRLQQSMASTFLTALTERKLRITARAECSLERSLQTEKR